MGAFDIRISSNDPLGRPSDAPRASADSPARPAPSAWCGPYAPAPRPVGGALPWHRSAPDCCKTYADHSSTPPVNCGRRPPPRVATPPPQIPSRPPRSDLGPPRRYVSSKGSGPAARVRVYLPASESLYRWPWMAGGDQVDRWDVAGDAVDGAMQAVVQRVDVAAGQTASGGDDVFGGEHQIVDGAQDAAVGGLCHRHLPRSKIAQRIDRAAVRVQRCPDRRDDGRADRAQAGGGDVRHEHREQG